MGYTLAERPDYVVLGARSYSFERITRGIRLIADGALHRREPRRDRAEP